MLPADLRIKDFVTFAAGTDRTELAAALDLPRPTVVSAVKRLLAAGELVELNASGPRPLAGRPPRELRPAGPATLVGLASWDLGRMRLACLDTAGQLVDSVETPAPDHEAGIAGLERAAARLARLARRQHGYQLRLVVFSVPAPFLSGRGAPPGPDNRSDATSTLFPVTATGDPEASLTERLGLPVIMDNDANLAALGELYAGAASGLSNVVYLKVNRYGFGSAIIVNGALARGARGYAGELAHLQVDIDGPLCACGGRGCLLYQVRDRVVQSAQPAYAEPIGFGDLPTLAAAGDPGAARMMRDIGRVLGGPLAHLCTFLDPELLLIGGTLGPSSEHVIAGIREVLSVQAPPAIADNLVVAASSLGPDAEVRGALEIARLRARRP